MSGKTESVTLRSDDSVMEIVTSTTMSKSAKIRMLYGAGHSKSAIAQLLEIRYQHVRNVLLQPLKGKTEE
jgi:hypothetical protein